MSNTKCYIHYNQFALIKLRFDLIKLTVYFTGRTAKRVA